MTIGILTEGSLGDSLMYIPTIRYLQSRYPGQEIIVFGRDPNPNLNVETVLRGRFKNLSFICSTAVGISFLSKLTKFVAFGLQLRRLKIRIIFDGSRPTADRNSNQLRAKRIVLKIIAGVEIDTRRESAIQELRLLEPRSDGSCCHISKLILTRVQLALNDDSPGGDIGYDFPLFRDDYNAAEAWAIANGIDNLHHTYVVGIGSKVNSRKWPIERFVAVMKYLFATYGLSPILSGGKGDLPIFKQMLKELPSGYISIGLPIATEAAVMSKCRFFLGVNSGPMHLAASAGLRCVVVFASDVPVNLWDPLGPGHAVIRTPIACSPCGFAVCPVPLDSCQSRINIETVKQCCDQILTNDCRKTPSKYP